MENPEDVTIRGSVRNSRKSNVETGSSEQSTAMLKRLAKAILRFTKVVNRKRSQRAYEEGAEGIALSGALIEETQASFKSYIAPIMGWFKSQVAKANRDKQSAVKAVASTSKQELQDAEWEKVKGAAELAASGHKTEAKIHEEQVGRKAEKIKHLEAEQAKQDTDLTGNITKEKWKFMGIVIPVSLLEITVQQPMLEGIGFGYAESYIASITLTAILFYAGHALAKAIEQKPEEITPEEELVAEVLEEDYKEPLFKKDVLLPLLAGILILATSLAGRLATDGFYGYEPSLVEKLVPFLIVVAAWLASISVATAYHRLAPGYRREEKIEEIYAEIEEHTRKAKHAKKTAAEIISAAKGKAKEAGAKAYQALVDAQAGAENHLENVKKDQARAKKLVDEFMVLIEHRLQNSNDEGVENKDTAKAAIKALKLNGKAHKDLLGPAVALLFFLLPIAEVHAQAGRPSANDAVEVVMENSTTSHFIEIVIDKSGSSQSSAISTYKASEIRAYVEQFLGVGRSYHRPSITLLVTVIDGKFTTKPESFQVEYGPPAWQASRVKRYQYIQFTLDKFEKYVDQLLKRPFEGGTSYYANIVAASQRMARSDAPNKALIVVSDNIESSLLNMYQLLGDPDKFRASHESLAIKFQAHQKLSLDNVTVRMLYAYDFKESYYASEFFAFLYRKAGSPDVAFGSGF